MPLRSSNKDVFVLQSNRESGRATRSPRRHMLPSDALFLRDEAQIKTTARHSHGPIRFQYTAVRLSLLLLSLAQRFFFTRVGFCGVTEGRNCQICQELNAPLRLANR